MQNWTACGRGTSSSKGFNFTSPADYPGGASEVRVTLAGLNSRGQVHGLDAQSYFP